jgi:osmotically inducible protein OsmC
MATRTAEAEWHGRLASGEGNMKLGSGAFEARYSFGTRFGEKKGTNPEELIAAAHAGCFSMALAYGLEQAGFTAKSVRTKARVHIEKSGAGFAIPKIELDTVAEVPGIDAARFQQEAETAKRDCPVSRALAGPEITLTARLARA